ncbi:MAG: hypothetical protein EWV75_13560 [Microcystis wesenbergii Mw_QC_S_20081001_S30D]|uniref:Uncharacterized protein n=1 Tax=Microcystis wesenbergii Mw_QC_S_20081001_S30D TaxID=2486245 RepID=A0A552JIK5_9CHRO|nr:MAG: hypothetical protein EWV75_13560 [Microcystis wesenbergii Mw_QC_S_20081001_S30D]TRU96753.1 MAG: hypothetical protein EWV74_18570 [Microcystis wesenbergii Mw_QC_S_20081001_S30]
MKKFSPPEMKEVFFPTPHTLHPTPYTLHPTPHTPHPSPQHPTPQHPNPQLIRSSQLITEDCILL